MSNSKESSDYTEEKKSGNTTESGKSSKKTKRSKTATKPKLNRDEVALRIIEAVASSHPAFSPVDISDLMITNALKAADRFLSIASEYPEVLSSKEDLNSTQEK